MIAEIAQLWDTKKDYNNNESEYGFNIWPHKKASSILVCMAEQSTQIISNKIAACTKYTYFGVEATTQWIANVEQAVHA